MDQDEALANEAENYKRKFRLHKSFQQGGFKLHIVPKFDPNAETVVIKRKKRHNK